MTEKEEAREYVRKLKTKLLNDNNGGEDKFRQFHSIMVSYKGHRIGPDTVISQVFALLNGHPDLIAGFARFLPQHRNSILRPRSRPPAPPPPPETLVANNPVPPQDQQHSPLPPPPETLVSNDPMPSRGHQQSPLPSPETLISNNPTTSQGHHQWPLPPPEPAQSRDHQRWAKKMMRSAVRYLNRVRRIVENDEIVKEAFAAITRYREHKDTDRVDKELSTLFKLTPEMHIEFLHFMAEESDATAVEPPALHKIDHRRKDKAKKELKKDELEDSLYIRDMVYYRAESAVKSMKKLQKACDDNQVQTPRDVDACLGPMNLRYVEFLYGDQGIEVVERLREDPSSASHVITPRLVSHLQTAKTMRQEAQIKQRELHRRNQKASGEDEQLKKKLRLMRVEDEPNPSEG